MKRVKGTFKLIRRSPYQALAAIVAMALTFFVSSIFIVVILGGQMVLNYIEQRPTVHVFFKDDAKQTQIDQVTINIKNTGLVREVKFISKEEALAIYRERFKNDPQLLESVSSDFLPASIDIFIKKPEDIGQIAALIKDRPEVDKIILPEDVANGLVKWTRFIRIGGIAFVSTLMAVSFLIIIMVVGMRIALRRDEISIMNLVGATKWYISKPFMFEGALYGIIGATIAVFLTYSLLLYYSPNIQNFLGEIQIFPIKPIFFVYLWSAEVLAATFVGIVGASLALMRYLRIK